MTKGTADGKFVIPTGEACGGGEVNNAASERFLDSIVSSLSLDTTTAVNVKSAVIVVCCLSCLCSALMSQKTSQRKVTRDKRTGRRI